MEKRIYSLNLMAYIIMTTGAMPKFEKDQGVIYAVFENTDGIKNAITEFNKDETTVNLHKFLNCFKNLKKSISELRG